ATALRSPALTLDIPRADVKSGTSSVTYAAFMSTPRRVRVWSTAVLAVLVLGAVGAIAEYRGRFGAGAQIRSLAVLPFANTSDNAKDTEYFSEGLTEELINRLSEVSGLQVTSRTASFAYQGKKVDPRRIASELGVRGVIEANV